ncbi:hypothetical protein Cni_G00792 [Canna indica]|uniref:Uncharacterized protein n=1 Tax=Canna indica TaxID=4628 RepID=A0AAQ3JLW7_9LILI|nr:hypothetical protein Cni_G00792 [Canna indica]
MGSDISEVVIVGELPSLPPIKTTTSSRQLQEGDEAGERKEYGADGDEECVTPTSEEHRLKPAVVCPAAPRKRRPAKRRLGPPPKGFDAVPCDLASIFLALPPKKRVCVV